MHFPNDKRQDFLNAVEAFARGSGSHAVLLKLARQLHGCSDIIPSRDRDLLHELIGGEVPPFTFDEAADGLCTVLAS